MFQLSSLRHFMIGQYYWYSIMKFYDEIFTFPLFLLNSKKLLLFWIIKQITIKLTVKKLSRLGSTFVYLPKYLSWFNASHSTSSSKHDRNHKFQSWLGFFRKHSGDQVSVAFLKLTVSAPPSLQINFRMETSSQASCYASLKLRLTDLLTRVKCRATSVAKNSWTV